MDDKLAKNLLEISKEAIKDMNLEIYSVDYHKEGKDNILTILIDREEKIDLDTCVEANDRISALLDKKDPIKEEYMLEVASAGVERPLITHEQFVKAIDKFVIISFNNPVDGFDGLLGYIKEVNDDSLKLEYKFKTRTKTVEISFDNIASAMTTVNV